MSRTGKLSQISLNLFGSKRAKAFTSWSSCKFSSNVKEPMKPSAIDRTTIVTKQPPLTQSMPGLAAPVYASSKEEHHTTKVTTLSNGLRIASENRYGQFCTIGVVIDSGCRYEVSYPSGVSHFLEKLAFQSTTKFPDKDKILMELEKYGGICDCQSSRDTFVYAASAEIRGLDAVSQVLGEIVLRPQLTVDEVDMAKQIVQFELETLLMRPEQENLLMDMIHAAAYRENTLGLPKLCPSGNVEKIDRKLLYTYLKHHYTPERMVVAGVGVEHDKLVESISKYFVETPAIWNQDPSLIVPGKNVGVDTSIAQYTGGMVQENCEIPLFAGPSGLPELAHVVVGFEGCSHHDPDFIAICVLNMIMGGGGSFSAGGPGKGMYTRLYTNVLNRYHWMYSATAYNHAYGDTGIFCIHASAPPPYVREMVQVIVREMISMAGEICPVELRRAKTQLQSMLLMNLESRAVVFEDVARQVLATNERKPPQHFIEAIENTTADDVRRVASRLLRSQPSVAARGDINKMPSYQDIQAATVDPEGRLPGGRLSMLRKLG